MFNFENVYNYITTNNNYGINPFINGTQDIYISNGVKYALDNNLLNLQELKDAIELFKNNNFGIAYSYDETPINGHEYGEYKTSIDADGEKAYLWIHREKHPEKLNKDYFICYFHFEN